MEESKEVKQSPRELLEQLQTILRSASFVDGDEDEMDRILDVVSDFISMDSGSQQECAKLILNNNEPFAVFLDEFMQRHPNVHFLIGMCQWFDEWFKTDVEELSSVVFTFFPTLMYLLLSHFDCDTVSGIHTLFVNMYNRELARQNSLPFGLPSLSPPSVFHCSLSSLSSSVQDEVFASFESRTFLPPAFPKVRSVTTESVGYLLNRLLTHFVRNMFRSPFMLKRFTSLCQSIAYSLSSPHSSQPSPNLPHLHYPTLKNARLLPAMVIERLCYGLRLLICQPPTRPREVRKAFSALEILLESSLLFHDDYLSLKVNSYYVQSKQSMQRHSLFNTSVVSPVSTLTSSVPSMSLSRSGGGASDHRLSAQQSTVSSQPERRQSFPRSSSQPLESPPSPPRL